jgi:Family of unknown function (DUF5519)
MTTTTDRQAIDHSTASQRITAAATSWPAVQAGPGRRGEFAFTIGRRQLGHLHGDHAAHFNFPKAVWAQLRAEGRITRSPALVARPRPSPFARFRVDSSAGINMRPPVFASASSPQQPKAVTAAQANHRLGPGVDERCEPTAHLAVVVCGGDAEAPAST